MKTLTLCLIIVLACCQLASSSVVADLAGTSSVPLRVGSTLNDSDVEAYYALENGFFRQVGLSVEMAAFSNSDAGAAALVAKTADIGIATPMKLAQAVLRGLPFTVIAAGAMNTVSAPAAWVCVSANSTVRSAKDLEGKTIALNQLKSSSENLLDAWLAKNGADRTKIKFLELPSSAMAPAIERGTVDAAIIFEPAFSAALKDGQIKVLAIPTSAMRNEYLQNVWYTTKEFAAENPDAVKRFASAIYRAAAWANTHHPESGMILVKLSKLDPGIVSGMHRLRYAESLQVNTLLPELENGFASGLLPRAVSPSELLPSSGPAPGHGS